jgi:hypothetical protein
MIKEYKKKPVMIQALKVEENNIDEITSFCGNKVQIGQGLLPPNPRPQLIIIIKTLEGDMQCHTGDYIIKGVRGEFYPCRGDIFEDTYECADAEEGGFKEVKENNG